MMYSFSFGGTCPHCGKILCSESAIFVDGHRASLDDDGVVIEDGTDHDLILSNPEPEAVCAYCNGELQLDPNEE